MKLDALVGFFQALSPGDVARLPEFYADDAWFKDPFNEVRGVAAIQRIFAHMFEQLDGPRFVVTGQFESNDGAMLLWEFHFRMRVWARNRAQIVRGVSHLRFDGAGKVCYHRDYWDTAEELYMQLPVLGGLMRALRRTLAA